MLVVYSKRNASRVAPTSIFMSATLSKPGFSLPPTSVSWEKGEARNRGAAMDGNVCATRDSLRLRSESCLATSCVGLTLQLMEVFEHLAELLVVQYCQRVLSCEFDEDLSILRLSNR